MLASDMPYPSLFHVFNVPNLRQLYGKVTKKDELCAVPLFFGGGYFLLMLLSAIVLLDMLRLLTFDIRSVSCIC